MLILLSLIVIAGIAVTLAGGFLLLIGMYRLMDSHAGMGLTLTFLVSAWMIFIVEVQVFLWLKPWLQVQGIIP